MKLTLSNTFIRANVLFHHDRVTFKLLQILIKLFDLLAQFFESDIFFDDFVFNPFGILLSPYVILVQVKPVEQTRTIMSRYLI